MICPLISVFWLLTNGCGYTTRSGLPAHLRTIYIKPLVNKIDLTQVASNYQQFPIYRHGMETDITSAIRSRFQFTGLLRPAGLHNADSRLEGELVEFRRDALRYDASQQVEEWRLSVVVNLWFYDVHANPATPSGPDSTDHASPLLEESEEGVTGGSRQSREGETGGTTPEGGGALVWQEERLTGDATYFATGPNVESEATALDRAIQDLARRVVERVVESW